MSAALAGESEYVDWRRFLLALLYPIPQPSQSQLLDTLVKFQEMEQKSTGYVSREQYDQVGLLVSEPSLLLKEVFSITALGVSCHML